MPATKMQAAAPPRPVRHVPHLFWGAGFAALSVAILLALGFLIDPARPYAFDAWVLRMLRRPGDLAVPVGPAWLKEAMVDITALGGATVLTLVVTPAMLMLGEKKGRRHLPSGGDGEAPDDGPVAVSTG